MGQTMTGDPTPLPLPTAGPPAQAGPAPPDPKATWQRLQVWLMWAGALVAVGVVSALAQRWLGVTVQVPPPGVGQAENGQAVEHAVAKALAAQANERAAVENGPEFLHFCGQDNFQIRKPQTAEQRIAMWPDKKIPWSLDSQEYRGPLTRAQLVEAYSVAWAAWSSRIDIEPTFVESEEQALVRCRFGVVTRLDGSADGPGGVLAWSELPNGTRTPRHQLYDTAERWTIAADPGQAVIDLVRVVAHELGHVIGLEHAPEGSTDLMAPLYSRKIRFPGEGDIGRAALLGYARRPQSGPGAPRPIQLSVTASPQALAEALRQAGYKVELNEPKR